MADDVQNPMRERATRARGDAVRALGALVSIIAIWVCLRASLTFVPAIELNGALVRIAASTAALVVAIIFVRLLLRTAPSPLRLLPWRRAPGELAVGVVLGLVLMTLTFGLMLVLDWYEFVRIDVTASDIFTHVAVWALVATYEELLFRGVVLGCLIPMIGPLPALTLSALLFGLAHVGGNIDLVGGLLIGLGGGLLFGSCALVARSLWLPIGVHLGWNLTQSAIFGIPAPSLSLPPGATIGTVTGPTSLAGVTASVESGAGAAALAAASGMVILSFGRHRLRRG